MTAPLIDTPLEHPDFAVRLVDHLLEQAVVAGASDIHIQPRSDCWEILFRIDGVLQLIGHVPRETPTDPIIRLMVLAGLPTYQMKTPLEGRLRNTPPGTEMRLGTFPTVHGTRAVVRLTGRNHSFRSLDDLDLPPALVAELRDLTTQRDGAVVITGPAGSGKTTTLYASLREIAKGPERRSIVTLEDPIEALLEGTSQSQIGSGGEAGMTLETALRSVLRQDPEVLLVGEIRDSATAAAALQASLTGHLVYTSLHAGDVAAALRRLVEMQIAPYLIHSGIRALCSQRLLRRLCPECREPISAPGLGLPRDRAWRERGCEACEGTGFRGRFPIAELLRIDRDSPGIDHIFDALPSGLGTTAIRHIARQECGMIDLRSSALAAVAKGATTPGEMYRVLGPLTQRG